MHLDNNSKDLTIWKKTGLYGYEYDSFVDYNIDICGILIYKYSQIFTNLKILIINSKFTNLQIEKFKN